MKTLGTGMKALFDCLAYFHRVFGTTVVLSHLTGHVIGVRGKKEEADLGLFTDDTRPALAAPSLRLLCLWACLVVGIVE